MIHPRHRLIEARLIEARPLAIAALALALVLGGSGCHVLDFSPRHAPGEIDIPILDDSTQLVGESFEFTPNDTDVLWGVNAESNTVP